VDAYGLTLLAHSWVRWVVVVLGVAVLWHRFRAWRGGDPPRLGHIDRAFIATVDAQLLIGLLLYTWLSPLPRSAFSDVGAAMADSVLRFYMVEHLFGMLVAIAAAHVGYARLKATVRAGDPDLNVRTPLVAQAVWLVTTLVSIPWPALSYGRPLARLLRG